MTISKFKLSGRKNNKQTEVLALLQEPRFELSVAQISEKLNLSKSTVSHHCAALRDAGVFFMRFVNYGFRKPIAVFVIAPDYINGDLATKEKKTFVVDRVEGKGVKRFVNYAAGSGQIAGKKDITLAFKPYISPSNNPNYTPGGRTFYTSGRGFFNGVKA